MNNRPAPEGLAATFPTKPLSACLESVKVPAKIPRSSFLTDGKLPIISQESDFINGYWDNEADAIHVDGPVVVFGDHTQVLKLIDFDFVVGADGVKILKPKEFLDAAFLRYFLEANPIPSLGYARHYRHISGMNVPLPPPDEQKRIVAVLDQAFAALDRARAHAEANLADAHAIFESELQASFDRLADGRDHVPFDRLCDAITPKVKIKRQDYLEIGAHPIVSQEASLVSGYWNDSTALLGLNDPVVVFGDHTCCLKYVNFDFVVGADGTKVLKPKAGVAAAYLYFGLRSQPIAEGGYARHFKLLRERSLPDIPLDRQRALTDRLFGLEEKCDDMARMYETKLADLANLRQSLLQKAFSGERHERDSDNHATRQAE